MTAERSDPSGFRFPSGFLWGTSTSAYQVEGGNRNSTWWEWEQKGRVRPGDSASSACDWWGGRAEQDFDRMAATYQNCHRLGVEWSRVEPDPGTYDEHALDRYRTWLRALRQRGIATMVTLHHFSDPLWLADRGGWENGDAVSSFGRFVTRVAEALADLTDFWCTVNEPNTYAVAGYAAGLWPPGKSSLPATLRVYANLLRGHAAAYTALKAVRADARVGWAHNVRGFRPARPAFPPDAAVARFLDRLFNAMWPEALRTGRMHGLAGSVPLPAVKGTFDWFGVNYYTRDLVAFAPLRPRELFARRFFDRHDTLSDDGFIALAPDGLGHALRWSASYGKPVFVTENGVCDSTDRLRRRYVVEHLAQVARAVRRGVAVLGYLHWTMVDNFEWDRGWSQRFGLWELDLVTQARRQRPSAQIYADICRRNALPG